jgi:RNA methyltransferase, TrmH family
LVERAVRAGRTPKQVVVSESAARTDPKAAALLLLLREAGCDVLSAPDAAMLELAEKRKDGIIFGLCEIRRDLALADVAARAIHGGPVLVLVNIEEPGNVGALIRTALASNASAVIASGVSDPYHPKAVRTSMGSLFKMPVVQSFEIEPVVEALAPLRRLAAVSNGGDAPWLAKFEPQLALFLGQESVGLPQEVVARLDGGITIPMPGGVDSFSVNAAAAVLLYEASRRAALLSANTS